MLRITKEGSRQIVIQTCFKSAKMFQLKLWENLKVKNELMPTLKEIGSKLKAQNEKTPAVTKSVLLQNEKTCLSLKERIALAANERITSCQGRIF